MVCSFSRWHVISFLWLYWAILAPVHTEKCVTLMRVASGSHLLKGVSCFMDDLNLELEVGDVGIDTYELSSLCIILICWTLWVKYMWLANLGNHFLAFDSDALTRLTPNGVFVVSGKQQATPCDQARGREFQGQGHRRVKFRILFGLHLPSWISIWWWSFTHIYTRTTWKNPLLSDHHAILMYCDMWYITMMWDTIWSNTSDTNENICIYIYNVSSSKSASWRGPPQLVLLAKRRWNRLRNWLLEMSLQVRCTYGVNLVIHLSLIVKLFSMVYHSLSESLVDLV